MPSPYSSADDYHIKAMGRKIHTNEEDSSQFFVYNNRQTNNVIYDGAISLTVSSWNVGEDDVLDLFDLDLISNRYMSQILPTTAMINTEKESSRK